MKTNLLVLDIDGTLTKSEDKHQQAFLETLSHFGFENIDTDRSSYDYCTDSHILRVNYEKSLKRDFNEAFIERFENIMVEKLDFLKPFQEIKGVAKALRHLTYKTNYAIAFATSSLNKPALYKLKQIGIPYNDALISHSNTTLKQEDIVKNAIQKAKLLFGVPDFYKIIAIGDHVRDFKIAEQLGLAFAGIGLKYQKELEQANVKVHLKDWTEFDLSKIEEKLF